MRKRARVVPTGRELRLGPDGRTHNCFSLSRKAIERSFKLVRCPPLPLHSKLRRNIVPVGERVAGGQVGQRAILCVCVRERVSIVRYM